MIYKILWAIERKPIEGGAWSFFMATSEEKTAAESIEIWNRKGPFKYRMVPFKRVNEREI